jgi:hypothetical protein
VHVDGPPKVALERTKVQEISENWLALLYLFFSRFKFVLGASSNFELAPNTNLNLEKNKYKRASQFLNVETRRGRETDLCALACDLGCSAAFYVVDAGLSSPSSPLEPTF